MINRLIFYLLLFTLGAFSCRQNTEGTYNYASLQVDTTKIVFFNWGTTIYFFPKFSEPTLLTNDDIKLVDSLLIAAVDLFNKTSSRGLYRAFNKQVSIDSFTIDLSKYKRQYFPFKDNNGQRVLNLNCFTTPFSEWRSKVYYGRHHEGISKFTLKVNLSDRKADELLIGGY